MQVENLFSKFEKDIVYYVSVDSDFSEKTYHYHILRVYYCIMDHSLGAKG